MSTCNICFRRERRKILCRYPLLSVAMPDYLKLTFFVTEYGQFHSNFEKGCLSKTKIVNTHINKQTDDQRRSDIENSTHSI